MPEEFTHKKLINTIAEIFRQSDRASALVSGALLEELLERLLLAFFMDRDKIKRNLFDGIAPLSTMSAKINIAYYLGLIQQGFFKDLTLIRKIRNDFAHSFETITFETQHIKDRCFQLKMLTNTPGSEVKDTKTFFKINTITLAAELLLRINTLEHLKPYQYRIKKEGE